MKVAVAVWQDRIAPVFDSAHMCLIFETRCYASAIRVLETVALSPQSCREKVEHLTHAGVSTLICGAVSRQCEYMLLEHGITLYTFVAGDVQDVLGAWQQGSLQRERFSMPGCSRPQRRCRRRGQRHIF